MHGGAAGGGDEGGSGGGDGGGGDDGGDDGGTGQAVWQTYFRAPSHLLSFHPRAENCKQSSRPLELLGSPGYQLVYDSGVLDGLHTHVPSDAASVPPIHTGLPPTRADSCSFCAVDCTVASCRPAFWQSASAPAHGRALFMSV